VVWVDPTTGAMSQYWLVESGSSDYGAGLAYDQGGDLFVASSRADGLDGGEGAVSLGAFLARLGADRSVAWRETFGGGTTAAEAIASDPCGVEVVVGGALDTGSAVPLSDGGTSEGADGGTAIFVARVAP